jgi:hypothetical protein
MQGLVQDERKDPPNAGSGSSSENRFLIDGHASLRYMWLGFRCKRARLENPQAIRIWKEYESLQWWKDARW